MYSIILYFFSRLIAKSTTLIELSDKNVNPCHFSLFVSRVFFSRSSTSILHPPRVTLPAAYIPPLLYSRTTVIYDRGVDKGICFATFIKAPFALKPSLFQSQLRTPFAPRPARLIRRGVRPHGDEFRNFLHKSASGTDTRGENYVLSSDSGLAWR